MCHALSFGEDTVPVNWVWRNLASSPGHYFHTLCAYNSPGLLLQSRFGSGRAGWGLRCCISNKSQGMLVAGYSVERKGCRKPGRSVLWVDCEALCRLHWLRLSSGSGESRADFSRRGRISFRLFPLFLPNLVSLVDYQGDNFLFSKMFYHSQIRWPWFWALRKLNTKGGGCEGKLPPLRTGPFVVDTGIWRMSSWVGSASESCSALGSRQPLPVDWSSQRSLKHFTVSR